MKLNILREFYNSSKLLLFIVLNSLTFTGNKPAKLLVLRNIKLHHFIRFISFYNKHIINRTLVLE